MLNIAICDDEKIFVDIIDNIISDILNEKSIKHNIIKYKNPKIMFGEIPYSAFDVYFLDISMPEVDGFSISSKIRKYYPNSIIVFISSKPELVFDSFNFSPFYFVCKKNISLLKDDLNHVIHMLKSKINSETEYEIVDNMAGSRITCYSEILYVHSKGHYVYYHLNNTNEEFRERKTIEQLLKTFTIYGFIRIHQRVIVNLSQIKYFNKTSNIVMLNNGTTLNVSNSYKESSFNDYIKSKRR